MAKNLGGQLNFKFSKWWNIEVLVFKFWCNPHICKGITISRASLPTDNAGNFSGDSLLICFDLVCFFIPFHRVPLPLSSIPQSFPSFSSVFTPCLMSCSYILFPFKQVSAGQLGCECLGSFEKLVAYALTPVTKAITKQKS